MVSVIHFGTSARRVLNYNEQKVTEGVAKCLEAGYYLREPGELSFNQKLFRLQNQIALAPNIKYNTVHISLNFHPTEQHDEAILKAIATTYLDKIGFAGQPYLLYQHFDAGHPHVHILTTSVKADGKAINLHNLGKVHSEKARKEIEIEFGLVRAEDRINKVMNELKPVNTKVQYGKAATKRAVTNILNMVFQEYKFCSLPELNAVLNLYNIAAEQGGKESRVYKNSGLVYRVRDADGNYVGVPIKASDFNMRSDLIKGEQLVRPTLKTLEQYFLNNKTARLPFKKRLSTAIDFALLREQNLGIAALKQELKAQGIETVLHYTKDEKIFGITFVDHKNGCVFNGSALGKQYTAAALLKRCGAYQEPVRIQQIPGLKPLLHTSQTQDIVISGAGNMQQAPYLSQSILDVLFKAEQDQNYMPYELTGKKKIKRKKMGRRL
ncbi:relaxase/mobilization nuclease domain-containing protein [Sphingobacterium siyangense]|uniref:relaxase/mobilization nuclease domain-containing protein n=1 Tax=Sphingobacterium siyangense TaxID=459529 RepID=UPI002FDE0435